jgi:hypothetical protein
VEKRWQHVVLAALVLGAVSGGASPGGGADSSDTPPGGETRPPGSGAAARGDIEEVPEAPEAGGPRNWEVAEVSGGVNLRERASATAPVVATVPAGTYLDNLGCRRAEGRVWCDVQPLGGGARGYVAVAYLQPAVAPDGSVSTGPDDSALRAGQGDFDATGSVPCSRSPGQPMRQCPFGVSRAGGGYATVVIDRADQNPRAINFRMGQAIGADTGEADPGGPFSATRENDLHLIRIGEERYEIPDAVIFGG